MSETTQERLRCEAAEKQHHAERLSAEAADLTSLGRGKLAQARQLDRLDRRRDAEEDEQDKRPVVIVAQDNARADVLQAALHLAAADLRMGEAPSDAFAHGCVAARDVLADACREYMDAIDHVAAEAERIAY